METKNPSNARKWLITGAVAAGTMLGAAGIATAATDNSASTATSSVAASSSAATTQQTPQNGGAANGHTPETLLTGSDAEKATAAGLKAVPGGTIVRVETDTDGGVYEAHVRKTDGSEVIVVMDKNFSVTSIEAHNGGPGGPRGGAQAAGDSNSSSSAQG